MKTQFRFLVFLLVAALWMTACQGGATNTTEVPQATPGGAGLPAGTFFSVEKPASLDPANADDNSRPIGLYLYEGLVRLDGNQVAPALAAQWTVSDDGLDYIFELRPGVVFHDGTQLNADVVMANFNRWFDPENPARGDGAYKVFAAAFGGFKGEVDADGTPISSFDGIEKVNDLTVLVHLNRADPNMLIKIAAPGFGLLSMDALASAGMAAESAVGTGPYKVGEWTDTGLTLVPNTDYWGSIPTENVLFQWK